MLNENESNESNLKAHLKTLHRSLSETDQVDEELQMLLRQLDGDIDRALRYQAVGEEVAVATQAPGIIGEPDEVVAQVALGPTGKRRIGN